MQTKAEQIDIICAFIRSLGIVAEPGLISSTSFLPGVEIVNGTLVYDEDTLAYPGDLLHEAGHIALIPAEFRTRLSGNVTENGFTDGGEEIGVMLWTYAACKAAGIPPEIVFHSNGYKGQSTWLLNEYASGNYIGLPLLQWMGLCARDHESPGFPNMIRWLRP
ncbi:MAG: hypothetical protein IT270_01180 [Saprospiraceae bacterium]|nr:hypothetical protein [Saprospiraceae bacterium]